jgi:hypothetical protein
LLNWCGCGPRLRLAVAEATPRPGRGCWRRGRVFAAATAAPVGRGGRPNTNRIQPVTSCTRSPSVRQVGLTTTGLVPSIRPELRRASISRTTPSVSTSSRWTARTTARPAAIWSASGRRARRGTSGSRSRCPARSRTGRSWPGARWKWKLCSRPCGRWNPGFTQSLRLDMADKLAEYFGLELKPAGRRPRKEV